MPAEKTHPDITIPGHGRPDRIFRVVRKQIPPELLIDLDRDFTEAEKEEIFQRINLKDAPPGNVDSTPIALWIFGPSAVGKSQLAEAKACELFGSHSNAVLVDGGIFREVHSGFCAVTRHGKANGVLHADGWEIMKNIGASPGRGGCTTRLKKEIINTAVSSRQHLIIPETAEDPNKVDGFMQRLAAAGYMMHALCLWAPLGDTRKRGEPRSVREGKVWTPSGYTKSTTSTRTLGQRFEQRRKSGDPAYGSILFYDNTVFPAREVHLFEFEKLSYMSPLVAEGHAKSRRADQRWHRSANLALSKVRHDNALKKAVETMLPKGTISSSRLESSPRTRSPAKSLLEVKDEPQSTVVIPPAPSLWRARLEGVAFTLVVVAVAASLQRRWR